MAYTRRSSSGYSRRKSGFARTGQARRRKSGSRSRRAPASGGNVMRLVIETAPAGPFSRHDRTLVKLNPPARKAKY